MNTLEEQSETLKEHAHLMEVCQINNILKEMRSYNFNTHSLDKDKNVIGAYDEIIEFLENEIQSR
jgi:hypothetical protein